MTQTKKNYLYNLIYQILILIIPLITAPYLARVIGAEGVGTYSYTYSIVYYFMLLTLLGVNNYGNRSIAKVKDNKEKLSKTFLGIYSFQLIMGLIMLVIYIGYLFLFDNSFFDIAILQSLFIISAILDINWFYFGLEEFKMTITRNTFVKIGTVILILLLVKTKNDLWKYTLIMSGMTVISQVILWSGVKKRIEKVKITKKDIIQHIKPNLVLFIPVIAISLYKMMDKIMLGTISTVEEVGFYENAEKIINIPMTIITALGTVMLPRISSIMEKGDNGKISEYMLKSINLVMFMSLAMCFGLIAVGYNFAPLFFGSEFKKTGILIMLLATTMPFLSFANVIRTQYLIPGEKDGIYIKSVFCGAIINLVMNLLFIPKFASIGACIGTISAEAIVMIYQTLSVRKELSVKKWLIGTIPFALKAVIMFIIIYPLNLLEINSFIRLILQIVIGMGVYGILNIKYIFNILDVKKILSKLNKKAIN